MPSLGWKTPIERDFGDTPDISNLLQFSLWELVYYWTPAKGFPSTREAIGHFVGIAENIGDFMTYYVLTDTGQVLARSQVRTAETEDRRNRRAEEDVEDEDNDDVRPSELDHLGGRGDETSPVARAGTHSVREKSEPDPQIQGSRNSREREKGRHEIDETGGQSELAKRVKKKSYEKRRHSNSLPPALVRPRTPNTQMPVVRPQ
jgi:hypothetical protein